MPKNKYSILTTAMQNADAMKAGIDKRASEITEQITSRQKLIRKAIIGVAVGSILGIIALNARNHEDRYETED